MNWDQSNRQLPFKLAAPFSFTAAEWANEMSANGIGLNFHDPDANQGYWIPYSAFADVTTAAVVTNIRKDFFGRSKAD